MKMPSGEKSVECPWCRGSGYIADGLGDGTLCENDAHQTAPDAVSEAHDRADDVARYDRDYDREIRRHDLHAAIDRAIEEARREENGECCVAAREFIEGRIRECYMEDLADGCVDTIRARISKEDKP